jgi:hypothetical protein
MSLTVAHQLSGGGGGKRQLGKTIQDEMNEKTEDDK